MSNLILYLQLFLLALIFGLVFTKALILFGNKYFSNQKENLTRFGGVAIIISFLLSIFLSSDLVFDSLKWGIIVSALVILFFGIYDDLKNVSWKKQLIGQILVVLIVIYAGLQVDYIANPLGGAEFRLDILNGQIFGFSFSVFGSLFILFWIVGLMNAMNWLDGLDGLSGGVGFIGAMTMFFLSISVLVNQPPLGILAIIFAGSILGFLVFNFSPAKIFMGTSGSMFLGFMLAVLAIFSGGKIATVFLVLGFPILDTVFVIISRIKNGNSPFQGDTSHFHYRLLDAGWSQKKVVLFIYSICLAFGFSALVFGSVGKVIAFFVLFSIMLGINYFLVLEKK
ncbi:MAG: undecaprenyl/decaprenyl-phosphate alpha-N-acetylglucosaminyl 1-phosphate transferase [Candidatus Pacebacteria bacterium]|nr:undecaprenyl/decaprenyl-phosphate alpha-N-acetylglucosaminyl 1-phosphate transferase [Candidatus Paceibacterota bacterium]